jgi:hypothetical protein
MRTKSVVVALATLSSISLPARAQSRIYFNVPRTPIPPVFQVPTTAQLAQSLTWGWPAPITSAVVVPRVRTDSLIARRRVCPMPVLGVDSGRVDRMPVVLPDSTVRSQMPVVDLRCDNPLRR